MFDKDAIQALTDPNTAMLADSPENMVSIKVLIGTYRAAN